MRKTMSRLFMAVLMVALLVSASIISVSAADAHETCTYIELPDGAAWEALPEADSTGTVTLTESGYYYMTQDVGRILINNADEVIDVTVCMCGKNITSVEGQVSFYPKGNKPTVNLVNCSAEGGTITGAAAKVAISAETTEGSSELNIYGNVNVEAAAGARALTVYGATVNMHGGTITGSDTSAVGLERYASRFNMYDGTITGNGTTITGNGGGVYMTNGTFNMSGDAKITACKAASGGGVYMEKGTFTMNGGTITGMTTTGGGGGVYVAGGTFTMSGDAAITSCTAASGGGVSVKGTFNMSGGTIDNNTGTSHSGGVFNQGTFNMSGNAAITGNEGGSYGGAVRNYDAGVFNMTGGTMTGNKAKTGGAVYNDAKNGEVKMSGGTITDNQATSAGNDVYSGGTTTATVSGTATVGEIMATGTVIVSGGTVSNVVGHSTMAAGKVITVSGGDIGNVTNNGKGDINVTGGNVTGALSNTSSGKLTITGGRFVNNPSAFVATDYKVVEDASVEPYQYRITDQLVSECPDHSAGWTALTADMIVDGTVTVTENTNFYLAESLTSGITITGTAGIQVTLCLNGNNITATDGTALRISDVALVLDNNNHDGGGIITGTTTENGGGVYVETGTFTMNGGTISNCTATGNGGGVYVAGGTFTMSGDAAITACKATRGGGVRVEKGSTFNMSGGTISNCTATGNTASNGGGVSTKGTFNMSGGTISNCTATGNTASGGGVHNEGTFNMSGDAAITGNNSVCYGGAVRNYTGKFNMTGGTMTGNEASTGGAVYNDGSNGEFKMSGGTITGNTATSGNDVYIAKTAKATVVSGDATVGDITAAGTGTVSGGTITGTVRVNGANNITITDGKISGALTIASSQTGTFVISGGQFSDKVTREALRGYASGYVVADVEDGDYIYKVGIDGFTYEGEYVEFESSLALGVTLSGPIAGYTATYTKDGETYQAGTVDGYDNVILAENIVAKEMDKDITFTITNADNDVVFQKTMSIYDVAQAWQGTDKETLVNDMINYGIAAQVEFNDDHKATMETLGATETAPRWAAIDSTHGVDADHKDDVAVTLSLKDQIELNVYVNDVIEEADVTTDDSYTYEVKDGITRISFKDIPVNQAAEAVTLTAGDAEVTFSITDYCIMAKEGTQKNLINALMKYIESVYQYYNK